MKKIIVILFLMSLILISSGCRKNKGEVINIACNLPMSGYIGYYGSWIQKGMEMAVEDLKYEADSAKISLRFDYQDNKGETREAITIFQKQMAQHPDIYMSGITTQTMSIFDQVQKSGVPHILWSWTPLKLDGKQKNFRCWVNYGLEGEHIKDYCISKNPSKVAFLHLNILGAKVQCDEVVVPALKAHNPDIKLYVEEFPVETSSFRDIAMKVKKFDADVIIVSGYKEHILNITKEFQAYKIDKSKVLCSMDLLDAINEVSEEVLEGFHVTAPAFNITSLQTEKAKDWIKGYVAKYGDQPTYTEAYGYDSILMLFEAIKISKGNNISIEEALRRVDIQGITGRLRFDSNGELEDNLHIGLFRNGVLEIE